MKKKYVLRIVFSVLFLLLVCGYLLNNFTIVFKCRYDENIGIIDTYINNTYDNLIVYKSKYKDIQEEETHGDQLIKFAKMLGYKNDVYYYEAVNEEGKIKTENVLKALEWMKENDVKRINISLSSKYKSYELEEWIKQNKDIKIYCSYNNYFNSVKDYPAMYDSVVASGSNDKINYKTIDLKYNNNKIILINKNGIQFFEGNSFLSLYTMLSK